MFTGAGPQFAFTGNSPQLVFTGPVPQFVFTSPGPQICICHPWAKFLFTSLRPQCVFTNSDQKKKIFRSWSLNCIYQPWLWLWPPDLYLPVQIMILLLPQLLVPFFLFFFNLTLFLKLVCPSFQTNKYQLTM